MDEFKKVIHNVKIKEVELSKLNNSSILITGGTGLIGSSILRYLSYLNNNKLLNLNIYAMARNPEKVASMNLSNSINWIYKTLDDDLDDIANVDYVIHTASPTDSKYFIDNPVETINSTIRGLNNILKFSLKSKIKSFVFLSSMEVYGLCCEDKFLNENDFYSIDCTNVRNSYSEGKKILECLCCSYGCEYDLPVKIVRLCQTFGPGVSKDDNRVFAQFARSVKNNTDIVLSTKGETKRSYCSISDAIQGIIIALLNGKQCEAYNLASDDSYYSIADMAQKFIINSNLKVIIQEKIDNKYLPKIQFGLNTDKIKNIGFKSNDNLDSIIDTFLNYYL